MKIYNSFTATMSCFCLNPCGIGILKQKKIQLLNTFVHKTVHCCIEKRPRLVLKAASMEHLQSELVLLHIFLLVNMKTTSDYFTGNSLFHSIISTSFELKFIKCCKFFTQHLSNFSSVGC